MKLEPSMLRMGVTLVTPRHADEGRHPRLAVLAAAKAWMPTFVGMTWG
jgi:hypothetical protein